MGRCVDCKRKRDHKRYAANPEKERESQRKRRAANLEKTREQARKRRAANPEKIRAQDRKWNAANPEKQRASGRKSATGWSREDVALAYCRARRMVRMGWMHDAFSRARQWRDRIIPSNSAPGLSC